MSPEELEVFANDPIGFIEQILGSNPWSKQCAIAESVLNNKRTSVRSCHGGGKTHVAAEIALWWVLTHPYSIVVTTAPTARQVDGQLWGEVRAAYSRALSTLGGRMLPKASRLDLDEKWFMMGFSTSNSDNFQGWHSEGGNLIIFDEATGVDPKIWAALNGVMTGPKDRFLAIGNPTESAGPFYDTFKKASYNNIHISADDVIDAFEGQGHEPVNGMASTGWIEEMKEECGSSYLTHPDYVSRVLGNFPDVDDRVLVPLSWMDSAEERWKIYEEGAAWASRPCALGVDVARYGKSRTIAAEGYDDLGVRRLHKEPKQSTMETAGAMLALAKEVGATQIRIDADGVGAGVADRCREERPEDDFVVDMRGGMPSELDKSKYLNKRAEWYWTMRMRLDPESASPAALPPDKALRAQLTSIRYTLTGRGQLKIESKIDMEKRGIKSPDEADAVVYSQALPVPDDFDVFDHLSAMTAL